MAVDYVYAPHLTVELQYVQVWFKLHLIQVLQCTQHPVLHQSIYSVYATKQHALYLQILYNTPVHECRLWLLKLKLKKSFKGYKFILIIKDLKFNSTEI